MAQKPSWRHLLKLHGSDFLLWMDRNNVLFTCITRIANVLQPLSKNAIQSSEEANAIWVVTPAVMSKCNEQETYGMPFASEAYAWLHLLDRYSRTWKALEVLTISLTSFVSISQLLFSSGYRCFQVQRLDQIPQTATQFFLMDHSSLTSHTFLG